MFGNTQHVNAFKPVKPCQTFRAFAPPIRAFSLNPATHYRCLAPTYWAVHWVSSFNKCGCSYMLPITSTCSSFVPNLENEQNVSLFPFPLFNSNLHFLSLYSTQASSYYLSF